MMEVEKSDEILKEGRKEGILLYLACNTASISKDICFKQAVRFLVRNRVANA